MLDKYTELDGHGVSPLPRSAPYLARSRTSLAISPGSGAKVQEEQSYAPLRIAAPSRGRGATSRDLPRSRLHPPALVPSSDVISPRREVRAAIRRDTYGATLNKIGWHAQEWSDSFFRVLDVAARVGSGVGSYGVGRYYVLLAGGDGEGSNSSARRRPRSPTTSTPSPPRSRGTTSADLPLPGDPRREGGAGGRRVQSARRVRHRMVPLAPLHRSPPISPDLARSRPPPGTTRSSTTRRPAPSWPSATSPPTPTPSPAGCTSTALRMWCASIRRGSHP